MAMAPVPAHTEGIVVAFEAVEGGQPAGGKRANGSLLINAWLSLYTIYIYIHILY